MVDRFHLALQTYRPSALERLLCVFVHGNVVIATAAASWVVTTAILVGLPLEGLPVFIAFAATLFVYTLNRVTDVEEDARNVPERAAFTERYGRALLAVATGLYLLAVVLAIRLGLPLAEFLVLPLVAAVVYTWLGGGRVFLVKNFLVGVAWGVIPLGVGVYFGVLASVEIVYLALYVTAMLTIAAVLFDCKDVSGDREAGIVTVPIVIGIRRTRLAVVSASVVVALVVGVTVALGVVPQTYLVLFVLNVYVVAYAAVAPPDGGALFYGLVVDGEHVLLAIVVVAVDWLVW